ncbi:radical SAM protein [Streptomyces osmaniensis]|uniref:Radical SAM core domain-containing protein n=1 Tax=Streptomyces osmaniensis TaxID=593134 RepID=A0ABP6XQE2_9ACTN
MTGPTASAARFTDTANLYLLTNCDMACSFCYASKGLGKFTLEQLRSVLDSLKEAGATHVNLTGGEPLMHPQVDDVVAYAAGLGFSITLFTSGSLLTEEKARAIAPHVKWFALSLDGTRETNLAVGRGEGHYEAALRSIEIIRAVAPDKRVRVTSVATRVNVENLKDLAKILGEPRHRPDLWRIKQMVPTRRANEKADELGIDDALFHREMRQVVEALPEGFPVQIHDSKYKSGDTMCIHPRGMATVTLGDGSDMDIVPLGNMLLDPQKVFRSWNERRDARNADRYNTMWQSPEHVTISRAPETLPLDTAQV